MLLEEVLSSHFISFSKMKQHRIISFTFNEKITLQFDDVILKLFYFDENVKQIVFYAYPNI